MKGEKLIQYLSIITSFILLYGVFFNWYYYKQFNIDITQYIELSEIVLLFFPSTPTVLFFLVMCLMFYSVIIIPENFESETLSNHLIYSFFYKNQVLRALRFSIFLTLSIGVLICFYIFSEPPTTSGYYDILSIVALLVSAIVIPINIIIFIADGRGMSRLQNKLTISTLITLVFYLFIGVVYAVKLKSNRVLSLRKGFDVSLYFQNGSKLSTDSSHVYLGKTSNYCFMYNKLTNESEAISMTLVGRIITKPKKRGN